MMLGLLKPFQEGFHANEKKYGRFTKEVLYNNVYCIDFLHEGGDRLGSVIKKRRKKMRKHKHRKLLARTRHQRRKGR